MVCNALTYKEVAIKEEHGAALEGDPWGGLPGGVRGAVPCMGAPCTAWAVEMAGVLWNCRAPCGPEAPLLVLAGGRIVGRNRTII